MLKATVIYHRLSYLLEIDRPRHAGLTQLLQLLPSGLGPEGAVAIPSRNLFVTANETDLVEDGGARSHVMIYERAEGEAAYPQIVSTEKDGELIGQAHGQPVRFQETLAG